MEKRKVDIPFRNRFYVSGVFSSFLVAGVFMVVAVALSIFLPYGTTPFLIVACISLIAALVRKESRDFFERSYEYKKGIITYVRRTDPRQVPKPRYYIELDFDKRISYLMPADGYGGGRGGWKGYKKSLRLGNVDLQVDGICLMEGDEVEIYYGSHSMNIVMVTVLTAGKLSKNELEEKAIEELAQLLNNTYKNMPPNQIKAALGLGEKPRGYMQLSLEIERTIKEMSHDQVSAAYKLSRRTYAPRTK